MTHTAQEETKIKRLKVGRACQPCRAKKIKCDGLHPCMQCKARARPCSYGSESAGVDATTSPIEQHKSDPASKSRSGSLIDRPSDPDAISPEQQRKASAPSLARQEDSVRENDEPDIQDTVLLGSLRQNLARLTIRAGDGDIYDDIMLRKLRIHRHPNPAPRPDAPLPKIDVEWPPMHILDHLVSVFFERRYLLLPIVHKKDFLRRLHDPFNSPSPLLLSAVLALASKHCPSILPDQPAIAFFNQARRMLVDFLDAPRVSTVQALLLMALFEDPQIGQRNRSSQSWMFVGMACRMCFECGLHRNFDSSDLSPIERDIRNRTFWCCFWIERIFSIALDRPIMILPHEITTSLPVYVSEEDPEELLAMQNLYHFAKLIEILYHVSNIKSDERDRFEKLDLRLRDWLNTLPEHLVFSPGVGDPLPEDAVPASPVVAHFHLFFQWASLGIKFHDAKFNNKSKLANCCTMANNMIKLADYLASSNDHIIFTYGTLTYSSISASSVLTMCLKDPALVPTARQYLIKGLQILKALALDPLHVAPPEGHKVAVAVDTFLRSLKTLPRKRSKCDEDEGPPGEGEERRGGEREPQLKQRRLPRKIPDSPASTHVSREMGMSQKEDQAYLSADLATLVTLPMFSCDACHLQGTQCEQHLEHLGRLGNDEHSAALGMWSQEESPASTSSTSFGRASGTGDSINGMELEVELTGLENGDEEFSSSMLDYYARPPREHRTSTRGREGVEDVEGGEGGEEKEEEEEEMEESEVSMQSLTNFLNEMSGKYFVTSDQVDEAAAHKDPSLEPTLFSEQPAPPPPPQPPAPQPSTKSSEAKYGTPDPPEPLLIHSEVMLDEECDPAPLITELNPLENDKHDYKYFLSI
ncbi:uncharacterized protein VTP21DRAFT_5280 [Calcarisporiella thermophila]|uniref:uncharacterized protein n=1 Tax=Calcarisporiella thermophila TaxID=911321 RepID=UPI0037421F43